MSDIVNLEVTPKVPFYNLSTNVNGKDDNFQVELNIGLALPFRYNVDSKAKGDKHSSMVRDIASDGSIHMLEVTTQSPDGPLQAVENDVLIALMSLAYEQRDHVKETRNGVRVYYTLAELCRRLCITSDSSYRISKAIDRIQNQNLTFKRFSYSPGTNSSKKSYNNEVENTKIILKSGRVKHGKVDDTYSNSQSLFWVELDQSIVNNLYQEYISVITQKEYLSLSSGNQRRVIVFLYSKRKKFGDTFIFNLDELSQVLGISDSPKKRRQIGEFLEKTSETSKSFEFSIVKRKMENDWDITIKFNQNDVKFIEVDPFWGSLVQDYGIENLKKIDFTEIDVINFRKEFDQKYLKGTGEEKFEYLRKKYSPGEFCIDITLWQVIRTNYNVTRGIKPLAMSILESFINFNYNFPDKYRSFVTDRVEDKKKNDTLVAITKFNTEKELTKLEEDKRFEMSFDKIYQHVLTDKELNNFLTEKAEELLLKEGSDQQQLIHFPEFTNIRKRALAKELMNGMELFDDIKELKKRFALANPESDHILS